MCDESTITKHNKITCNELSTDDSKDIASRW